MWSRCAVSVFSFITEVTWQEVLRFFQNSGKFLMSWLMLCRPRHTGLGHCRMRRGISCSISVRDKQRAYSIWESIVIMENNSHPWPYLASMFEFKSVDWFYFKILHMTAIRFWSLCILWFFIKYRLPKSNCSHLLSKRFAWTVEITQYFYFLLRK